MKTRGNTPLTKAAMLAVIVACVATYPAFADEEEGSEIEEQNSLGVFVGLTAEGHRENGLALGIEGTHFFSESYGLGGVLEYTFGDIDSLVGVAAFVYRTGRWKVYAGPGFESSDAFEETEFLIRVGGDYRFNVGSIEIAPQVNVDFVEGDAVLVFGAFFGKSF